MLGVPATAHPDPATAAAATALPDPATAAAATAHLTPLLLLLLLLQTGGPLQPRASLFNNDDSLGMSGGDMLDQAASPPTPSRLPGGGGPDGLAGAAGGRAVAGGAGSGPGAKGPGRGQPQAGNRPGSGNKRY